MKIIGKILRGFSRFICNYILYRNLKSQEKSIFDEEWDNLIILDACRYDMFEKILKKTRIRGKLRAIISKGSNTPSFLQENFKIFHNEIVYISANPYVNILLKNKVYKIISSWFHGWNRKLNNVDPKVVVLDTLKALKKYPKKKLIIHFLQPHSPYPNRTGETFLEKGSKKKKFKDLILGKKGKYKIHENIYVDWHSIYIKPLPIKKLKKGYIQNLILVLSEIEKLVNILPGKTVITADHGECFGEKIHFLLPLRIYGHPGNLKFPILVKVPWLIVKKKKKIDIEKEYKEVERLRISRRIKDLKRKFSKFYKFY